MQFGGQNYVKDKDGAYVLTDAPIYEPASAVAAPQLTAAEKQTAADAIAALKAKDLTDLQLGTTAATAYRGDRGLVAYTHAISAHNYQPANANIQAHIAVVAGNPHGTTLANLGYTAPTIANSTATDIAGLVADFNALLGALRTAGILAV